MLQLIKSLLHQELLLSARRLAEWLNPLLFFIIIVTLFPVAISPDKEILHTIAPGLIWVAAVLASMLGSERLFTHDFADGSLEQLLLTPWPLPLLVAVKVFAHWLITILPLLIICPLLGLLFAMTGREIEVLIYSMLLGTPSLCLLMALMVALTLGLASSRLLLALLLLPIYVPVLIFSAGSVLQVGLDMPVGGQLALLTALLVLLLTCTPFAIAAALRLSVSQH